MTGCTASGNSFGINPYDSTLINTTTNKIDDAVDAVVIVGAAAREALEPGGVREVRGLAGGGTRRGKRAVRRTKEKKNRTVTLAATRRAKKTPTRSKRTTSGSAKPGRAAIDQATANAQMDELADHWPETVAWAEQIFDEAGSLPKAEARKLRLAAHEALAAAFAQYALDLGDFGNHEGSRAMKQRADGEREKARILKNRLTR